MAQHYDFMEYLNRQINEMRALDKTIGRQVNRIYALNLKEYLERNEIKEIYKTYNKKIASFAHKSRQEYSVRKWSYHLQRTTIDAIAAKHYPAIIDMEDIQVMNKITDMLHTDILLTFRQTKLPDNVSDMYRFYQALKNNTQRT